MVGEVGFYSQMPRDKYAETDTQAGGSCQRSRGRARGQSLLEGGETSVERGDTKESACIAAYQAEAQQGADRQAGSLQVGEGGCLCLPGH